MPTLPKLGGHVLGKWRGMDQFGNAAILAVMSKCFGLPVFLYKNRPWNPLINALNDVIHLVEIGELLSLINGF